jgi:hypothetical protein
MEGFGPNQIETILNKRGIDPPAVHQKKNGIRNRGNNTFWGAGMVGKILSRMEYLGHTVSGRTYKKSYKDKRTHKASPEDWIITENTHDAIIDLNTWNIVQKLREKNKKKSTNLGEMGVLNGLLYCADCGKRLRIQRDTKTKFQYYVCATYASSRSGFRQCTIHNTPRHFIEPLILGEIREITEFAREREAEFVAMVEKTNERTSAQEMRSAKNELAKAEHRADELDHIIKKIYEDNATGRLTNERFDKMYADYEAEQSSLKYTIAHLSAQIETEQKTRKNVDTFLALVKKHTDIKELTHEIVRVFIEKIVCHQANGKHGKNRIQQIDIYYNYIGLLQE